MRKGRLSVMDDPPCPECESSFWTRRSWGNTVDESWYCLKCEVYFDPPSGWDGNE